MAMLPAQTIPSMHAPECYNWFLSLDYVQLPVIKFCLPNSSSWLHRVIIFAYRGKGWDTDSCQIKMFFVSKWEMAEGEGRERESSREKCRDQ